MIKVGQLVKVIGNKKSGNHFDNGEVVQVLDWFNEETVLAQTQKDPQEVSYGTLFGFGTQLVLVEELEEIAERGKVIHEVDEDDNGLTFDEVVEGGRYKINKNNESNFEIGEEVIVVRKGVISPTGILVKTTDPNTTIKSLGGHGTQLVDAYEISKI